MLKKTLLALGLAAGFALSAQAAVAGNQLAVAIGGYDTVSYHDGAPLQGEARFNAFHNGAVWYFSSEENRYRVPPNMFTIGQGMLGPTIMALGTAEKLAINSPICQPAGSVVNWSA